jgi:hypothetical protein
MLVRRTAALTALVVTTAGSVAIAAGDASPQTIPDADGWAFTTDLEGWTDGGASCTILNAFPDPFEGLICATTNERADEGFLRTKFETLANGNGAVEGEGTFVGPAFSVAVPAGTSIASATLEYDRKLEVDQLIAEKGARARTDVLLVDENGGTETLLNREDLSLVDSAAFVRRTANLGATAVKNGGSYHLKIRTGLTSEDGQIILGTVAAAYDNIKLTVEPTVPGADGATGPTGPTGPAGPVGDTGQAGAQGQTGANGAQGDTGAAGAQGDTGAAGAQGAQGESGAAGAQGAQGPAGTSGKPGTEASINSDAARRLLTISRLQAFLTRGPFSGQLRTRVFCRRGAEKRCEGVVKIRTLNKVNTAFMPGRRVMKRVTLGTGAYRLNIGQVGYAKVFTTSLARKIIAKRGPLKVEVLFTALDEDGGQQTLRRVFKLKSAKK